HLEVVAPRRLLRSVAPAVDSAAADGVQASAAGAELGVAVQAPDDLHRGGVDDAVGDAVVEVDAEVLVVLGEHVPDAVVPAVPQDALARLVGAPGLRVGA